MMLRHVIVGTGAISLMLVREQTLASDAVAAGFVTRYGTGRFE